VFYRDIFFYIVSYLLLTVAVIHGSITLTICIIYLVWYAIFIVIVGLEDVRLRRAQRAQTAQESEALLPDEYEQRTDQDR